jgi:hypothetical protein
MALLDDLLSTLNFVTPARSSSAPASNFRGEAGSGLSGLANAGNRAMGEQEQALAILSRMSGQQKMELFGGPSGEYMSLEEEAADPRTGTANRIVYTMSKMMPAEEPTRFQPPMGSDTITITELPPLPTEADILSADMEQGGMMMAEPNPRSLAFAENLYPKTLPNEEARIRGMSDFLEKEGGAYGGPRALDAASGMETGYPGRILSSNRGAAASDFEQEQAAVAIGSLLIPGKIGVEGALLAARAAGPRALQLVTRFLREKGLLGPSDIVRRSREFGSTGAARQTLARQGTELDPRRFGPGDPMGMARGGKIRQSILNRYGRMI